METGEAESGSSSLGRARAAGHLPQAQPINASEPGALPGQELLEGALALSSTSGMGCCLLQPWERQQDSKACLGPMDG